ncbi:MAG: DUF6599 family protein [Candidatus Aminicenantaceae bacterium]
MRKFLRSTRPQWLILVFGILWSCADTVPEAEGLMALVPEDMGGWVRHGAAQAYTGDDLFTYINGGAEIYHEFGFEEVVVQDYRTDQGGAISLEIYRMTDPESAFGIFTFKRSSDGQALDFPGAEAQLEDYYLNLWKGPYLVTLTGFDEEGNTIQGLRDLARALAFRMPETGQVPDLVRLLPEKDRKLGSVKYFKGPLALFNSHSFAQEDIFSLEQGVRGDYADGGSLFIFAYEAAEKARAAFLRAEKYFTADPAYSLKEGPGEGLILLEGPRESFFQAQNVQTFILVSKLPESSELPAPFLTQAKERIEGR